MTARLTMVLAALIALVAIAAGCGGDDDGGGVASGSLTKAEFVKRVNDMCESNRQGQLKDVQAYAAGKGAGLPPGELYAAVNRDLLLPQVEEEIETIEELGAPEGDEAKIEAFVTAQRRGIEEASKIQSISEDEQVRRYFRPASELAREYGIDECANSPAPN